MFLKLFFGNLADRTTSGTVRSAIDIILSSVRPSVCLSSAYNAVHCGFQGRCTELKVIAACCPFRYFCCKMYRSATKRTTKIESKKTRELMAMVSINQEGKQRPHS